MYGDGYVIGTVIDNSTSQPIEDVQIGIGSGINYTNSNGFYNITAHTGYQYIVALKDGYYTHMSLVNVTIAETIEHNITLNPIIPTIRNGTIQGTVIIFLPFIFSSVILDIILTL